MPGKPSCGRCGKRSSTERVLRYGGGTYGLPLCSVDDRRFSTQFDAWQNVAWSSAPLRAPTVCDRCDASADTVSTFKLDGERSLLYLCDRHADALQLDVFAWSRDGRLLSEDLLQPQVAIRGERVVIDLEPAAMDAKSARLEHVPAIALAYEISEHAKERIEERGPEFGFNLDDVLRTVGRPELIRPDKAGRPDVRRVQRGNLVCVVNVIQKRVLTVHPVPHAQPIAS